MSIRNNVRFRRLLGYFSKNLDFVEASYLSPYGMIRTKWQRENQQVTFNVEIPANVIATLLVPGMDEKVVGSGKYTFTVND